MLAVPHQNLPFASSISEPPFWQIGKGQSWCDSIIRCNRF